MIEIQRNNQVKYLLLVIFIICIAVSFVFLGSIEQPIKNSDDFQQMEDRKEINFEEICEGDLQPWGETKKAYIIRNSCDLDALKATYQSGCSGIEFENNLILGVSSSSYHSTHGPKTEIVKVLETNQEIIVMLNTTNP